MNEEHSALDEELRYNELDLQEAIEEALDTETEIQKKCPFCHGFSDKEENYEEEVYFRKGKNLISTDYSGADMIKFRDNTIGIIVYGDDAGFIKFNYCPMCERRLSNG